MSIGLGMRTKMNHWAYFVAHESASHKAWSLNRSTRCNPWDIGVILQPSSYTGVTRTQPDKRPQTEVTLIWGGGCYMFDTLSGCRKHLKEVGIVHAGQVTAILNIFFYVVLGWRICNLEALIWSCTTVVAHNYVIVHKHTQTLIL